MADSKLKIDARRRKIIDILGRDGQVRVTQLSESLGATTVTIRSDLDFLEQDGYLERVQGGAVQTAVNQYNREFLLQKKDNSDAKKKIAATAAELFKDGDTLFINSGTTTYFTAVELKKYKNLNIVTNSITVAVELGAQPTFSVILLGGKINSLRSFTYGDDLLEQLRRYKANYAILSIDGICVDSGVSTLHAEEAAIDRVMIERAKETIIVADSKKIGREGFLYVTDISRISKLVTDSAVDRKVVGKFKELGVETIYR